MTKPALFIWLIAAPVLAGIFITALLLIPSAEPALRTWVVIASLAAAVMAVPFSLRIGKTLG